MSFNATDIGINIREYTTGFVATESAEAALYTIAFAYNGSTLYYRWTYLMDLFTSRTISGITFGSTSNNTAATLYIGNIWRVTRI
jgi:hypothetical protein